MAQARRKEREAEPGPHSIPAEDPAQEGWRAPSLPRWPTLAVLGALVALFNLPVIHYFGFRAEAEATASIPYSTTFDDAEAIERDFFSTGGLWRTERGELVSPGVKNNPLWLKARLPRDVAIEFDVRSMGSALGAGDIKVEVFGDGSDHASGYVLIHGGWNNTVSIIARLDEHAPALSALETTARETARLQGLPAADVVSTGVFRPDTRVRVERAGSPVQTGQVYHWRIERRGRLLTWFIDGQEFLRFDDPFPFAGETHDRFGFSSWESQLYFDNLRIQPL